MKIKICKTINDFTECLNFVKSQNELVLDLETKGLEPLSLDAKILTCAVGYNDTVYAFPVHYYTVEEIDSLRSDFIHKVFLEISKKKIIGHNLKFEWRWLSSYGSEYQLKHLYFDTMLAHALLDENSRHDLDTVIDIYLTDFGTYKKSFAETLKNKKDYETADLDQLLLYNAKDVYATGKLRFILEKELKKDDALWWIFNNYTMKNVPFLSSMEENGFYIDTKMLLFIEKEYTAKIDSYEKLMVKMLKSYGWTKQEVNFTSYVQLRDILYGGMKFPIKKKTKINRKTGGGGQPSTNFDALEIMKKDNNKYVNFIDTLIKRQQVFNIRKSFVYPMMKRIEETKIKNVIRTSFNQHIVETGRLSSSGINFQNFPTKWKMASYEITSVKKCIVSRFKGGGILQGDYSQIELRTAGMYSEDEVFVNAFREKKDLHGELAEKIYGKEYTKEQRKKAKTTNFSAIFDITAETLSNDLEISVIEADKLIHGFRSLHPILYKWFGTLWIDAKRNGFIRNFMGRKRRIEKDLDEADQLWKIESIKRQIWNFPIQSTAVELMLTGMRLMHEEMKKKNMKSLIICNVHDSIIVDYVPNEVKVLTKMMRQIFEKDVVKIYPKWNWIVPLKLDISFGKNMNDLEDV